MAVVNVKTSIITTEDAAGEKLASNGRAEHVFVGTAEAANGDSIASVYRLIRVPSNFVLTGLRLAWDALGGSAAGDVGVYQTAANDGTAVDADEFASAVALSSAGGWTDILEEAAATDIAKIGQPLWERLGLTADSGRGYDLAVTLTAASGAAGTVSMIARGYYK
jgi:hypothetical protein